MLQETFNIGLHLKRKDSAHPELDQFPLTREQIIEDYRTAYASFTFDHRILDGGTADAFVAQVKQILEEWPKN